MSLLSGISNFFGLDIGTTAIRLVQLGGGGPAKSLLKYAYVPVDSKVVLSDSASDQQKLLKVISDLLNQAQVTTKDVAVGVPSNRVFTTVVDFDRLAGHELARALHYQAEPGRS
jgi:Tfp pilus assembly PilM family ATPase